MRIVLRSLPALSLMVLIFWLSSQPNLATDFGVIDIILRKGAHMTVFGLLWILWWYALNRPGLLLPTAISFAYAISDETHQHFVDGRYGSPFDVMIDGAGIAAGIGVTAGYLSWRADRARSG